MDVTYFVFDHNSKLYYDLFFHYPHFLTDGVFWIQIVGGFGTFVTLLVFLLQQKIDRDKRKEDEIVRICNT